MKVRKEVWYVLAIAVIIVLIMIVFRDEIGFSPRAKTNSPQNDFYSSIYGNIDPVGFMDISNL